MRLQWDQTREAPLRGGEPRLHSALERIGLPDDALTVSLEKTKKGGSAGMNHTVKKIWNAVSWLLVAAVVVLAVLLAGVRLVGLTPYAVLSGSMEPTYPVGSLIYVKDAGPEDVQVGDPITFVLNEDLVVATHRVIDIDQENGRFYTKGDANDAPDGAPVLFENLVGKPVFCVPELGYFSEWITHPPGMYIAVCAALILLIIVFLPDWLEKADESDRKAAGKKKREAP